MDKYETLLSRIDERLTEGKYNLWRKLSMVDLLDTDIFATRIKWMVGRNSEHIFLQYKVTPSPADFVELFDEGLSYAKRAFRTPLPMQLWTNYKLVGCIATTNIRPELIEFVTKRPGEHWTKRVIHGYYQLPVLIDIDSGKSYYYQGLFCRSLQKLVSRYIEA